MISAFAFAAASLQAAAPSTSSTTAPVAPQVAIIAPVNGTVLRTGAEVPLRLLETLNSNDKAVRAGNRVRMEVAAPVMLGSSLVIPAGSPATGEITEVRRKGMWGKSGRIGVRVLHARVGDRTIRLSGTFDDKGVTGTAGVVGAIALVPIAGFLVTGTSANIPSGSGVKAFLDEDLTIVTP
ncbi:hypothetical protein H8M03_00105 [Sphingomonas sabuli]|uniref:TrbI/VirB10 family protein n=1 Tax=Sphingomonas sabuli TaxID=2764186 RepID=A0A7G9L2G8_9SPHN|nr:hypothetical protein [Sphingomonas sabuli]QNM82817.1 hypothetical protein H8M03_00105 [Sphingomonas sabuli]